MSRVATAVLTLGVTLLLFAGPAAAIDSFFDIFTEIPGVGFAPLPPHDQGIGHMTGGSFHLDLDGHTTLRQMAGGGGSQLPARIVSLNGLPPGEPWIDSFFDVFYDLPLAGGQPYPVDSFFDIFYEIDIPAIGPAHLAPLHPGVPNSFFDVFVGDSFFDITYRVEVGPGGGCHELHTHFECSPGFQPGNVQVTPSAAFDSFFDVFFELHVGPGPIQDPSLPLIHAATSGEYLTGPLAVEPATWGKVKSLYR